MDRIKRDFFLRDNEEQRWLMENTWCDTCQQADLGLKDPLEYEDSETIFLEGKCNHCGHTVIGSFE